MSPTKKQEDIGNAALPRKGRVSFKEDNEISEVLTVRLMPIRFCF